MGVIERERERDRGIKTVARAERVYMVHRKVLNVRGPNDEGFFGGLDSKRAVPAWYRPTAAAAAAATAIEGVEVRRGHGTAADEREVALELVGARERQALAVDQQVGEQVEVEGSHLASAKWE